MSQNKTTLTITPVQTSINYFSEIWQFRDLLSAFVVRDLKLRYKQTFLGVIWVVLQPLLSATLLTFIFGSLFQTGESIVNPQNAQPIPYALFVFCGLVFWNFFSDGLNFGANSLINQANLIKKIYFPKIIAPLSALCTAGVNFLINLVILLIGAIAFGYSPSLNFWLILLPVCLLMFVTTLGVALLFSALNLKFRDVKQILPFLTQILLFLAPVIYPVSILPTDWQWLAYLNPLTSVIDLVRWSLLQTQLPSGNLLLLSCLSCLFIFSLGFIYFRRTEQFFADIA